MPQVDFNNHETGKHAALRGTLPCFWLYQVLLGNSRSTNSLPGKDLAMKATWLYRIAAVLFILFAAGASFWVFIFSPPFPAGGGGFVAVDNVFFYIKNTTHTPQSIFFAFCLSFLHLLI